MRDDMRLYLGFDAGGTKTHALIADQAGHVRGVGCAGPGNWEIVGLEGTYRALAQALDEALAGTGLDVADLCAAGYGMAGLDWPSDEERLAPVIQRLGVAGPGVLVNDAFAALRAGSRDGCGVAVVASTGTTIAGRNHRGERFRTFGHSAKWGDFGCAVHVVWLATRAVGHAYFGRGRPTALTGRFIELYHVGDISQLVEKISRGRAEPPDGRLASLVFEVAAEGDAVAQQIVRCVGRELGKNAVAVADSLGLVDRAFDLVMAGGLFRSGSGLLLDALLEPVRARAPLVRPVSLRAAPVVGSALLAMEAAGVEVTPDVWQRLCAEAMERSELIAPYPAEPPGLSGGENGSQVKEESPR
jgi:N-acetylglucosamine kinase-like BadF-type ATPase